MTDQNPYSTPDASLGNDSSGEYNPSIISFSGRIGRLRYLAYNTALNLILMAIMILLLGATGFMASGGDMSAMGGIASIVLILFYVVGIVISVMFGKRRLNDL